ESAIEQEADDLAAGNHRGERRALCGASAHAASFRRTRHTMTAALASRAPVQLGAQPIQLRDWRNRGRADERACGLTWGRHGYHFNHSGFDYDDPTREPDDTHQAPSVRVEDSRCRRRRVWPPVDIGSNTPVGGRRFNLHRAGNGFAFRDHHRSVIDSRSTHLGLADFCRERLGREYFNGSAFGQELSHLLRRKGTPLVLFRFQPATKIRFGQERIELDPLELGESLCFEPPAWLKLSTVAPFIGAVVFESTVEKLIPVDPIIVLCDRVSVREARTLF